MFEKVINMNVGLEARSVALFVQTANKFISELKIQVDNRKINAKSIMGVLSLGISEGQEIAICAEGEDEKEAVNELVKFLQTNVSSI